MVGELLSRVDEKEWTRLAKELAYCFAGPLRMSRDQYLDTLPSFTPEPTVYRAVYREIFDTLILVQTPVPEKGLTASRIFEIIELPTNFPYCEDWKGARFKTPRVPYATWLDDGERELNLHPTYYPSRYVPADTRLGTSFDGAFFVFADRGLGISRPSHGPYLPGSGADDQHAAYMCKWSNGWALTAGWFGDPGYGVVTARRQIVIGKDQRTV